MLICIVIKHFSYWNELESLLKILTNETVSHPFAFRSTFEQTQRQMNKSCTEEQHNKCDIPNILLLFCSVLSTVNCGTEETKKKFTNGKRPEIGSEYFV